MEKYPIASKITLIMNVMGWNQEETAVHFMVDPATITRWKQGRAPESRLVRWYIDRWESIAISSYHLSTGNELDKFTDWIRSRM